MALEMQIPRTSSPRKRGYGRLGMTNGKGPGSAEAARETVPRTPR